jgi:hypothetical protein
MERNSHGLIEEHFLHLLGGAEEYHENINEGNSIPGKDSKRAPQKHDYKALLLRLFVW